MWKLIGLMLLLAVAANADSRKVVCGLDLNGDGAFQENELGLGARATTALRAYHKTLDALNADSDEVPNQVLPTPQEAHRRFLYQVGDITGDGKITADDYNRFLATYSCHED